MDNCPDWMLSPNPYSRAPWAYPPMCGCSDFVPSQRSRTNEEIAEDFAKTISITTKCHVQTLSDEQSLTKNCYEYFWAAFEFMVKYFGEMSKDDFEEFQKRYRDQVRQNDKGSNEQGNSNCEKGSGESNEVHFLEGNGSDI